MKDRTPAEIVAEAGETGVKKAALPMPKLLVLGVAAGIYIAMGGVLSLVLGYGFPEAAAANPGLQRLLSGMTFPLGLILVVLAGAELFTGNNAALIPGLMDGRIKARALLRNWIWVYVANFAGAALFAWIFAGYSGITAAEHLKTASTGIAEAKTSLSWGVSFVRGIGANWLVCLAVWLGLSSKRTSGKIAGLWFPVFAFVALGYEHSIANMFFIPLGMYHGAEVSVEAFLLGNLLPVTLGNIVGGALFVGCLYGWLYGQKKAAR